MDFEDSDVNRLSLIDVSCEDDCLINNNFPAPAPARQQSSENQLCGFMDVNNVQYTMPLHKEVSVQEQAGRLNSPEMTKKSGKYNLRKSLAWDTAFFTSAGFLDPDELSSVIGETEKSAKKVLPVIQEDMQRSTESFSTMESDNLTPDIIDNDLFEDIRASIQKSSKVTKTSSLSPDVGAGLKELPDLPSSMKGRAPSQDKQNAAEKKRTAGTQGLENTKQSVAFSKPPKILHSVTSAVPTKRASVSIDRLKAHKENTKSSTGDESSRHFASVGSRISVSKPRLPPKLSTSSSLESKKVIKTNRSSVDSTGSTSSSSRCKSSSSFVKKNDSTPAFHPKAEGPSRCAPRMKNHNQLGSPRNSSNLKSVTKVSSSISPRSSISEWSSESSSSSTAANRRTNSSRAEIDTRSRKQGFAGAAAGAVQDLNAQNCLNDRCSKLDAQGTGSLDTHAKKPSRGIGLVQPASIKPSGLRMPSPKIGFFDGTKSARTPDGSIQCHSGSPSFAKIGAGAVTPSLAKNRKIQVFQPNPPSPLQEGSKVSTAKRNAKGNSRTSPKVEKKTPRTTVKNSMFTTECEVVDCKQRDKVPEDAYFENDGSSGVLNNATQITYIDEIADIHVNLPHKIGGGDQCHVLDDTEKISTEDQIDCLAKQVGELDIGISNQDELICDFSSSYQAKDNRSRELSTSANISMTIIGKDLVCNQEESFDASSRLTVNEVENSERKD